jgi:hypothetical protein
MLQNLEVNYYKFSIYNVQRWLHENIMQYNHRNTVMAIAAANPGVPQTSNVLAGY